MKLRILAASALALALSGCELTSKADGVPTDGPGDILDVTQAGVSDILQGLADANPANPKIFLCLDEALNGDSNGNVALLEGADLTVTKLVGSLSLVVQGLDLTKLDLNLEPLVTGLVNTVAGVDPLLTSLLGGETECLGYTKSTSANATGGTDTGADNPVTQPILDLLRGITGGEGNALADTVKGVTDGVNTLVSGLLNGITGGVLQPLAAGPDAPVNSTAASLAGAADLGALNPVVELVGGVVDAVAGLVGGLVGLMPQGAAETQSL